MWRNRCPTSSEHAIVELYWIYAEKRGGLEDRKPQRPRSAEGLTEVIEEEGPDRAAQLLHSLLRWRSHARREPAAEAKHALSQHQPVF